MGRAMAMRGYAAGGTCSPTNPGSCVGGPGTARTLLHGDNDGQLAQAGAGADTGAGLWAQLQDVGAARNHGCLESTWGGLTRYHCPCCRGARRKGEAGRAEGPAAEAVLGFTVPALCLFHVAESCHPGPG